MTTYIALLRAINLGKRNKVKMADLRQLLESLGLKNVQTYIQSGNVIFDSDKDSEFLTDLLEREIQSKFGFPVPVILRTASEWKEVMQRSPYVFEEMNENESLHVSFLSEKPSQQGLEKLDNFQNGKDKYQIIDKEIYILFGQNFHKSNLPTHLQKLGVSATLRNWKTVMKLDEMIKGR